MTHAACARKAEAATLIRAEFFSSASHRRRVDSSYQVAEQAAPLPGPPGDVFAADGAVVDQEQIPPVAFAGGAQEFHIAFRPRLLDAVALADRTLGLDNPEGAIGQPHQ